MKSSRLSYLSSGRIIWVLGVVGCLAIVFFGIKSFEYREKLKKSRSEKISVTSSLHRLSFQNLRYKLIDDLEGTNLNSLVVKTPSNKKVELTEFLNNETNILIFYNIAGCGACYDAIMSFWTNRDTIHQIGFEKPIFILSDMEESRIESMLQFQKAYLPHEKLFVLSKQDIPSKVCKIYSSLGKMGMVVVVLITDNQHIMYALADAPSLEQEREKFVSKLKAYTQSQSLKN